MPSSPAARRVWPSVLGGAVALATGSLVAWAWAIIGEDFAAGDLPALVVWTVPLAVAVTLVSPLVGPLQALPPERGAPAAMGLGAVLGLLWTAAALWIAGPWFGLFSGPMTAVWVAAGTAGFAAAYLAEELARVRSRVRPRAR